MPLYRAGTVSLVQGEHSVTGEGTQFGSETSPGDILVLDGSALGTYCYEILSVESDTALTLDVEALETVTDAGYVVIRSVSTANNLYLMRKIDEFLKDRQRSLLEMVDWLTGTAGGGANSDGKYPLTDRYGTVYLVKTPAQLEADYEALADQAQSLVDDLGGIGQAVTDTAASAAAALASKNAAASSESEAAGSASAALASETAAATSASNAAASESEAALSASGAATSESNAASSQSNAATSEANASASATLAQKWATQTTEEVVSGDGYGAKKYAQDAAASATEAQNTVEGASSDNYSETPPATTWPGLKWADATSGLLKRRNDENDGWIVEGTLFKQPLSQYDAAPTTDQGPIYVPGVGNMEWDSTTGAYVAKAGGATGGGADQIFYLNGQTVTEDYAIPEGMNAGSFGLVKIAAGKKVTIPPGSTWDLRAAAGLADFPWLAKPIGERFGLPDHLAGCPIPPTTNPNFRFIKLTAGDAYNDGVLTSESVSGSAPLVIATAVISLADSPLNGETVNLWNTERRSSRAGASGTLLNDALQDHSHVNPIAAGGAGSVRVIGSWQDTYTQNNGNLYTGGVLVARIANETRIKSEGETYYMRIK